MSENFPFEPLRFLRSLRSLLLPTVDVPSALTPFPDEIPIERLRINPRHHFLTVITPFCEVKIHLPADVFPRVGSPFPPLKSFNGVMEQFQWRKRKLISSGVLCSTRPLRIYFIY